MTDIASLREPHPEDEPDECPKCPKCGMISFFPCALNNCEHWRGVMDDEPDGDDYADRAEWKARL
jgi:hypothetical protein